MKFTAVEIGQILGGDLGPLYREGERGVVINQERDWIRHRYTQLRSMVGRDGLRSQLDAMDRARAEWVEKNVSAAPPEHVFLIVYSEGHGRTVVGVSTDEKRARRAGKGKNWYGGDCDVEKHRVNAPVVYEQSSRVIEPTPKKRKRSKRAG